MQVAGMAGRLQGEELGKAESMTLPPPTAFPAVAVEGGVTKDHCPVMKRRPGKKKQQGSFKARTFIAQKRGCLPVVRGIQSARRE